MEQLQSGFVEKLFPWKADDFGRRSQCIQGGNETGSERIIMETRRRFRDCFNEFDRLKPKRDALVHAHPITDIDGAQILNYQGELSKPISDLKWDEEKVCDFARDIDAAVCRASELFHKIKNTDPE